MNTATVGANAATFLVYGASLIVVLWCVIDVTRRPSDELTVGRKACWVLASLVGWLLFGIVGAAIAAFYLIGPRRKMNAQRLYGAQYQSANPVTPDRGQAARLNEMRAALVLLRRRSSSRPSC